MSYHQIELRNRQSGRTYRMVQSAIQAAAENPTRSVYILVAYPREIDRIMGMVRQMAGDDTIRRIHVVVPSAVPGFSFDTLTDIDHPEHIHLLDHHLIFSRFQPILEELHRYDPPAET